MKMVRFLKGLVLAPVLAIICTILGLLVSAGFVFFNLAVHHFADLEHGIISHAVNTFPDTCRSSLAFAG